MSRDDRFEGFGEARIDSGAFRANDERAADDFEIERRVGSDVQRVERRAVENESETFPVERGERCLRLH